MSDTKSDTKIPYRKTEEYKAYRREYMKNYRVAKKAPVPVTTKKIKDTTKKQYISIILKLHHRFSPLLNQDLEEYLNKVFDGNIDDYTIKYIKRTLNYVNYNFPKYLSDIYTNKNSLKVNLIPYVSLLSRLTNDAYLNKIYIFLSKYAIDLNKEYENARDDNEVADEDKNKIIIDYDKNTLNSNLDMLDSVYEKMIYALYTFIPPRRLEFSNMIIDTIMGKHRHNKENNYLIMKKKVPYMFIFQDYKTDRAYGRQEIMIPPELSVLILNYLKYYGNKTGDKFIRTTSNSFGKQISMIFSKIYNTDISLRWLRISYSTYIQSLNISNNEKKKLVLEMGHSPEQSTKYKKIIDKSSNSIK